MSKENMISDEALASVSELESLVALGSQSEAQQGLRLRAIQIGMATSFCSNLAHQNEKLRRGVGVLDKISEKLDREVLETIESMSPSQLLEYQEMYESRLYKHLSLQRQVIQGKGMFPEDALSDDDRKALRLIGSLQTPEEKRRFNELLEAQFGPDNSFAKGVPADSVSFDEGESDAPDRLKSPKNPFAKKYSRPVLADDVASATAVDVASTAVGCGVEEVPLVMHDVSRFPISDPVPEQVVYENNEPDLTEDLKDGAPLGDRISDGSGVHLGVVEPVKSIAPSLPFSADDEFAGM